MKDDITPPGVPPVCHSMLHQKIDLLLDIQRAVPCPALIKLHDEEFVSLLLMPCACSMEEVDFSGPLDLHCGIHYGRVIDELLARMRRACTCRRAPYAPATAAMGLDEPGLAAGLHDQKA